MLSCHTLGEAQKIQLIRKVAPRRYLFFLDPAKHITAWVALTIADEEAGCMQVIPGSHKNDFFDHDDDTNPDNMIPRGQGLAIEVETETAVGMPLQAGQMSLHHTKLFHASFNNMKNTRRIGFGISYIPTDVKDIGNTPANALLVPVSYTHLTLPTNREV